MCTNTIIMVIQLAFGKYSHTMPPKNSSLSPRKKPVQDRSAQTVTIIFEATVQVLLALGPEKLTTTKVADRAGVSVGTLYQYFSDKQSLLAAVLKKHLEDVADAVALACKENQGKALEPMVNALVKAFFDAKFAHPEMSKALYSIAADIEGNEIVAALMARSQASICELLSSAQDARFTDPITTTFVISTIMVGPVQALLTMDAPKVYQEKVCEQLVKLSYSYLREIAV